MEGPRPSRSSVMASSIRNKRKVVGMDVVKVIELPDHVFAMIQMRNESGRRSAGHIGRNYNTLTKHHQSFIDTKPLEPKTAVLEGPNDCKWQKHPSDPPTIENWLVQFNITLANISTEKQMPGLHLILGRGSPDLGENLGVDILVVCPEMDPSGVLCQHAVFQFSPYSGVLMIGGLDNDNPVQMTIAKNNRLKEFGLRAQEWQVLLDGDRFMIGELECVLKFPQLVESDEKNYRRIRDKAFAEAGLTAPDPRIPVFPPKNVRRVGGYLLYQVIGKGGFGNVSIAVGADSGHVRAAKELPMMDEKSRALIMNEAKFSMDLSGKKGFPTMFGLYSFKGFHFRTDQIAEMEEALAKCPLGDTFFFIFECGKYDFGGIKITEWDFLDVVDVSRDILEALVHLHKHNCLQQDATVHNFLVLSDTPGAAKAVLIDPGKACFGFSQTSNHIAPIHCLPPEINGTTPYDDLRAEAWLTGFALARVFCPEIREIPSYSSEARQTKAWVADIHPILMKFGKQSPVHTLMVRLVTWLLAFKPEDRCSVEVALARFPKKGNDLWHKKIDKENEERPTKKAKIEESLPRHDC